MRKLILGLLLAATACSRSTTVQPSSGGMSPMGPRPALEAFLTAVRAQDLQALSNAWGDKDGSVRDSGKIPRDDLERRELIMICYLRHDRYRILSEQQVAGGERVMQVELTRGTISRTTNFFLTNTSERWFVRSADMEPVRDLCTQSQPAKK